MSTLYLPAFKKYASATGAVLDPKNGLYTVSEAQYQKMQPLTLIIAGSMFTLPRYAVRILKAIWESTCWYDHSIQQIFPRSLNSLINGTAGKIYLSMRPVCFFPSVIWAQILIHNELAGLPRRFLRSWFPDFHTWSWIYGKVLHCLRCERFEQLARITLIAAPGKPF